MTRQPGVAEPSLVGHYAGPVTRALAYALDSAASIGSYAVLVSLGIYVVNLITGIGATRSDVPALVWSLGLVLWLWLYYGYSWSVSGQTLGMAVVGIRVVRRDGAPLRFRQAFVRPPALALSFLTGFLGFVGVVVGRERRALHDVVAGTAVVYSWDARAARLRFLARHPHPAVPAAPAADVAGR
jgi:uncharacterized RDD family membrane protein YckC